MDVKEGGLGWEVGEPGAGEARLLILWTRHRQDRKESPFPSRCLWDTHLTPQSQAVPMRASPLLFSGMAFGLGSAGAVLTHHPD